MRPDAIVAFARRRVALGHLVKHAARVIVEVAAVAGGAVQEVMDPLGQDEELLVAAITTQRASMRVDAGLARVREHDTSISATPPP